MRWDHTNGILFTLVISGEYRDKAGPWDLELRSFKASKWTDGQGFISFCVPLSTQL